MKIKFGQSFQMVVSPVLVLDIEGMLEEWVAELAEKENFDLERESIGMAQKIVGAIAQKSTEVETEA